MQDMRQQKATSHELGSIIKFKVMLWTSILLWTKFAFYSRVQLPSSDDCLLTLINPIQARGSLGDPPNIFVNNL